jgi:hypothetical protein
MSTLRIDIEVLGSWCLVLGEKDFQMWIFVALAVEKY